MRRRREWFERIGMHMALWWIPVGEVPTVAEAELRLAYLRERGPTPYAFTFKTQFVADERVDVDDELRCPA